MTAEEYLNQHCKPEDWNNLEECLKDSILTNNVIEHMERYASLRIHDVSHCGLTEIEYIERERLIELQRSRTRWFSQQEFDRLKELSNKMFKNAGSPHCG